MQYSTDVVQEILTQNKSIKKVSVIEFSMVETFQNRFTLNSIQTKAIEKALKIRKKNNLPFWDSLLLTQFDSTLFSEAIIKEALFHNSIKKKTFIDSDKWDLIIKKSTRKELNLGFNSVVRMNTTKQMHIPLLDFHIPNLEANVPCVIRVLKQLKVKGYLLKTNKSFHFYGTSLLNETEFVKLLSQALLFSPIIDKNWIAHQLIEGSATLRITPKDGLVPYLIKKI